MGAGNDVPCDRKDRGLWSCNGGSVGTQVQGSQGRKDSRKHRCPGAPTKLTKAIGKAIIKFTEGKCNRHLSAIRVHIQRRFDVVLTRGRIEKYLIAQGLKPFRPQKQPLLLPQQKKKRVKF